MDSQRQSDLTNLQTAQELIASHGKSQQKLQQMLDEAKRGGPFELASGVGHFPKPPEESQEVVSRQASKDQVIEPVAQKPIV